MSEAKRWDLWEVILEETDSTWVRWEDYARLKAEVERLRKAGDWLPIESAPRDGSYFIGGVWGDMESRPTWATMCHYYVRGKRFEMQETCDQPDFWIPLPNAPKEGKPSA